MIFWRESGLHAHKVKQHWHCSNVPTCHKSTRARAQNVVFDGFCCSSCVWTKRIHYHILVVKKDWKEYYFNSAVGTWRAALFWPPQLLTTRDKNRYGTFALSAKCTQGKSQTYNFFACLVMSDFSSRIVIQQRKGSWIRGMRKDIKGANEHFFEEQIRYKLHFDIAIQRAEADLWVPQAACGIRMENGSTNDADCDCFEALYS